MLTNYVYNSKGMKYGSRITDCLVLFIWFMIEVWLDGCFGVLLLPCSFEGGFLLGFEYCVAFVKVCGFFLGSTLTTYGGM